MVVDYTLIQSVLTGAVVFGGNVLASHSAKIKNLTEANKSLAEGRVHDQQAMSSLTIQVSQATSQVAALTLQLVKISFEREAEREAASKEREDLKLQLSRAHERLDDLTSLLSKAVAKNEQNELLLEQYRLSQGILAKTNALGLPAVPVDPSSGSAAS